MTRKLSVLLSVLLFLSLLSGCWSRRELNELGIAVGIGVDKAKNGYRVTVQVVSPGEIVATKSGGNRTPVTVYEATAETIFEGIRKITTKSSREIYLAHLRVLVIGEQLAREGIQQALDHFSRDHEVRTDYFVIVAKESSASDVLKVLTPIEKIPANNLYLSLDTSQKLWAPTATITLDQLISDLVSEGNNPILSAVTVVGKQVGQHQQNIEQTAPPGYLKYTGLAVFKKDKLVGWLNEKESKGFSYITDRVKNTVGPMACPNGGKFAVEVIKSKTKIKGKMMNGDPQIHIDIKVEENIGEVQCQVDLTKREIIAELESLAEKRITAIVMNSVNKVKKYKADIFGFGDAIHRADPAAWKSLKENWDERFVNVDVSVSVDTKIRRIGTVANSFQQGGE